jgi:hypothetical protein
MNSITSDITSIALAIVGVAVLAVLVSRNANTTGVINSSSSAFNTALATAEGPVTGYSPGAPIYGSSTFGGLGSFGEGFGAGFNTSSLG